MKTSKGRKLKKNEVAMLYLEAKGYTEVESKSTKYKRLNIHVATGEEWPESAWIGKAGAIRYGRTISQSWPMRHWSAAWARYQAWETA